MRAIFVAAAASAALALAGCGPAAREDMLPTAVVNGTLLVDGKPFGPAQLSLLPETADAKLSTVGGKVGSDGHFQLTTYAVDDGAPAGTYRVELQADLDDPTAPVPVVKPATVTIPEGGGDLTIELVGTGKMRDSMPAPY